MAFGHLQGQVELLQIVASSADGSPHAASSSSTPLGDASLKAPLQELHRKVLEQAKKWRNASADAQDWLSDYESSFNDFQTLSKSLCFPTPSLAPGLTVQ